MPQPRRPMRCWMAGSRERRVCERAYLGGIAHVRAQELRRTAGTADRFDRRSAPRLVVPDDENLRPTRRELDGSKAPHPLGRPREQHRLPFMLQSAAASRVWMWATACTFHF